MSRYDATLAETITLTSQDGEPIEAYVARPLTDRPLGGVVVLAVVGLVLHGRGRRKVSAGSFGRAPATGPQ